MKRMFENMLCDKSMNKLFIILVIICLFSLGYNSMVYVPVDETLVGVSFDSMGQAEQSTIIVSGTYNQLTHVFKGDIGDYSIYCIPYAVVLQQKEKVEIELHFYPTEKSQYYNKTDSAKQLFQQIILIERRNQDEDSSIIKYTVAPCISKDDAKDILVHWEIPVLAQ